MQNNGHELPFHVDIDFRVFLKKKKKKLFEFSSYALTQPIFNYELQFTKWVIPVARVRIHCMQRSVPKTLAYIFVASGGVQLDQFIYRLLEPISTFCPRVLASPSFWAKANRCWPTDTDTMGCFEGFGQRNSGQAILWIPQISCYGASPTYHCLTTSAWHWHS